MSRAVNRRPTVSRHLAFGEIEAFAPHVTTTLRGFKHSYPVALALGVLLNHDGIGAGRHRRPCEDARRFALADVTTETLPPPAPRQQYATRREYGQGHRLARHSRPLPIRQRAVEYGGRRHPLQAPGQGPQANAICSGGKVSIRANRRCSASSTEITGWPPNLPIGRPICATNADR